VDDVELILTAREQTRPVTTSRTQQHPLILDPHELIDYLLYSSHPAVELDDLEDMLVGVGRNAGPLVVFELYCNGELPQRWASVLIPDVWAMVEFPSVALEREEWRALFNYAGYTYKGRRRARPRNPRRLYRGADEAHRDGWSWTDDQGRAEWFAARFNHLGTPGQVWQAVVEPWRLFARIDHVRLKGEREYVVDTDGLAITQAQDGGARRRRRSRQD